MKQNSLVVRSLAMISQFGINMIVPILMCTFVGIYLDKWLGTSFMTIILFFMGALAGGRNIYIFAKSIYKDDTRKDNPYVSRIEKD
ncbi:MAG: AtpZ/AtpI family protein [Lachnospiraceae bacterium]